MSHPTHLRGITSLAAHRNRCAVVVVCHDAVPPPAWAARLAGLDAALRVEMTDGHVSRRLGRPVVVVCDECLEIVWTARAPTLADVERALEDIVLTAGRCPGAGEEAGDAWR